MMAPKSLQSHVPILLFSFDYPPNLGGIARLCEDIARGLNKRGREVTVLTESNGSELGLKKEMGINVHRLTSKRPIRELQALKELATTYKNHFVLCGTWYPEGLLSMMTFKHGFANLLHGAELLKSPKLTKEVIYSQLRPKVLNRASINIGNSDFTTGLGKKIAPHSNTLCLPLGVDLDRLPLKRKVFPAEYTVQRPLRVLTVARLHEFKGVDTVLEALSKMPSHDLIRMKYTVVGEGPHKSVLEELVKRYNLENSVEFKGKLSHEDLKNEFEGADIFVMCTRRDDSVQSVEGFGLVYLEALSFGTPVVGTQSGGIPTAIKSGEGGWLIEERDSAGLKEILQQVLRDSSLLEEQSKRGQLRLTETNNMDHYSSELVRLLDEVSI